MGASRPQCVQCSLVLNTMITSTPANNAATKCDQVACLAAITLRWWRPPVAEGPAAVLQSRHWEPEALQKMRFEFHP